MRLYLTLLLGLLRRAFGQRRDLLLENLVLRQQLAIFERQRRRPVLRNEVRIFWSLVARNWSPWRLHLRLVQPDTVIRWHRTAWQRYWTWKSRGRRPGRPRIDAELRELIILLARENPRWGAVRLVGELPALGFSVSARTVRRYRDSALRRPPSQSWRTFLHNHASHAWAVDLFTVQTISMRTLYAVVFISHERRRIEHVNVTAHPTAAWLRRQLLEATPWGTQPRFLIRDRDLSYGGDWVVWTARLGIASVLTPVHAPNANAIAERVIGTIRRECLDHVLGVQRATPEPSARRVRVALQRPATASLAESRCTRSSCANAAVPPVSAGSSTSTNGRMRFCHPTPNAASNRSSQAVLRSRRKAPTRAIEGGRHVGVR